MEVKIYSINDCKYCEALKTVLLESFIPFIEVKVRRLVEGEGEGMSFTDYLELEPDIPVAKRCIFPQVYFDGKYVGNMQDALDYLYKNETK